MQTSQENKNWLSALLEEHSNRYISHQGLELERFLDGSILLYCPYLDYHAKKAPLSLSICGELESSQALIDIFSLKAPEDLANLGAGSIAEKYEKSEIFISVYRDGPDQNIFEFRRMPKGTVIIDTGSGRRFEIATRLSPKEILSFTNSYLNPGTSRVRRKPAKNSNKTSLP